MASITRLYGFAQEAYRFHPAPRPVRRGAPHAERRRGNPKCARAQTPAQATRRLHNAETREENRTAPPTRKPTQQPPWGARRTHHSRSRVAAPSNQSFQNVLCANAFCVSQSPFRRVSASAPAFAPRRRQKGTRAGVGRAFGGNEPPHRSIGRSARQKGTCACVGRAFAGDEPPHRSIGGRSERGGSESPAVCLAVALTDADTAAVVFFPGCMHHVTA